MVGYRVNGCVYLEVLLLQNEICKANLYQIVRKKPLFIYTNISKNIIIYKDKGKDEMQ